MSNATSELLSIEDFRAKLCPEIELLLCCARLSLPSAGRDRIMLLLGSELDWVTLVNQASRHGLVPLLYRHLNALAPAAVPKAIFRELWGRYESNSRRNRAMANELLNILRMLDANGIPAVAYKGPALAAAVYGDLALREFGDLDILLRRQDVSPATTLLQSHGYVPKYDLKPAAEAAFLRSSKQYHLVAVHGTRSGMVELHWKTDVDFPVEPAADNQWWANLGFASLGEGKIRCFATEELLLILCLHGTKHAWGSLGWLVDVAELIRQHPDLKWEWAMEKAAQLKCERRLAVGLYLADHLLDAPLPEKVRNKCEGVPQVRQLANTILGTIFHSGSDEMSSLEGLSLNLSLYERPRQKFRHCINVVLAPTTIEWLRWPLPRPLFFLYWPLRLFRLIAKYGFKFVDKRRWFALVCL